MVAVFLPVLPVGVVLCFSSRDVTRLSYVAVGTKKTKGGAGVGVRYVTGRLVFILCGSKRMKKKPALVLIYGSVESY